MSLLPIFLRSRSSTSGDSLKPLPWIDEEIIKFEWEKSSNKYFLRIPSNLPQPIVFEIDLKAFEKITSRNLSKDISHTTYETYRWFKEALKSNDQLESFSEWWKANATRIGTTSRNGKLFQFDFSQGPWEIPWEMLLGLLKLDETRKETTIVRCIGQPENECKSFRTEALRSLIIQADAPDLDLDKDVNQILTTWNALEQELKLAVLKPVVIKAERASIIQQLHDYRPHMIWFLGHGFFDRLVHLKFSKDDPITAIEFSQLFDSAGHCPEFAVFWACESAKGIRTLHSEHPELFTTLASKGVGTVIGMQSLIADDAAIVMASQLFRGIAQGIPLEWAISWARTWIYTINGEETPTMDWAAPVVWTAKRPIAHLNWNQTELDQLQLQLLGTASIEKGQRGVGLDAEPPDDNALRRALDWLPFSITVVRGDPKSTEHKLWFLRTLKGVQAVSKNAVIVIVPLDGHYHKKNLQDWAQGFLDSLENVRLPEEFFTRIDILSNDAEIGWRRLCSLENVFLAVIDPPPASEDWFWAPFFRFPDRRAILTQSEIPERFNTIQVNYVTAGEAVDSSEIDAAMEEHYRLLAVLALLNIPIRNELLRKTEFGSEADNLFAHWPHLFVRSFGGFVIRADTRRRVLSTTDGETLSNARFDCLKLADIMGQAQKPYLKELKIELLLDSNNEDSAVKELSNLLHLYRQRNEQIPLLRAAMNHRYFRLREGLTSWELLQWASLFVQLGEQRQAAFWLSRSEPESVLDIPLKLSLEAEVKKNDGYIDQARVLIEEAIAACTKNRNNYELHTRERQIAEMDYLRYRHDRARLLQFQERKYSDAAKEYREIIEIVENTIASESNDGLIGLLAVAHRNLGECILDLDDRTLEDRNRDAESHYQSALHLERERSPFSHLIAEIHYQLARLFEKQSRSTDVRRELDACIASAEESRHGLIAAIAKNRLLWLDVKERDLHWKDIAQRWELVADSLRGRREHSWSTRTLLNSNIKAAHLLMNENQNMLSQERLNENLETFRQNPHLRREGDLIRIIKTLAGLHVNANRLPEKQEYWNLLELEFPDAEKLAKALGWSTPQEAW